MNTEIKIFNLFSVGRAKEHSDVPTRLELFGGHASLCPPYDDFVYLSRE